MKRLLFSLLPAALLSPLSVASAGCAPLDPSADEDVESSESNYSVDPALEQAAKENLLRLDREIDAAHLGHYGGWGERWGQFLWAMKLEYGESPALLQRRFEVLASPVYFSMPEIQPHHGLGRRTPFHGMDEAAYDALIASEDYVYGSHRSFNGGSKDGIRPFSVCETKFLIEIAKGEISDPVFVSNRRVFSFNPYAQAYAAWATPEAGHCEARDLTEWYNYRGLGHLRPSWLEANYQDRILRRMVSLCRQPPQEHWGRCGEFGSGRLRYREKRNQAFALRLMAYDPSPESLIGTKTDREYTRDPYSRMLLVEDRMGDGIADMIVPGPLDLFANARFEIVHGTLGTKWVTVSHDKKTLTLDGGPALTIATANVDVTSTGTFTGELRGSFTFTDGTSASATLPPRVVKALMRVDPAWKAEYAGSRDLGLLRMFPDGSGCSGEHPTTASCPLLERLTSMLDRHEHFYKTYTSVDGDDRTLNSQPSPLVACSVTLGAADGWAHAGTPPGGRAGMVFLMRVPFADILTGDARSIDTLGRLNTADPLHSGPKVKTLASVYATGELDMSRVWLDLATLSNDLYSYENEISKFGAVPAEQIEGILVTGKPGALP